MKDPVWKYIRYMLQLDKATKRRTSEAVNVIGMFNTTTKRCLFGIPKCDLNLMQVLKVASGKWPIRLANFMSNLHKPVLHNGLPEKNFGFFGYSLLRKYNIQPDYDSYEYTARLYLWYKSLTQADIKILQRIVTGAEGGIRLPKKDLQIIYLLVTSNVKWHRFIMFRSDPERIIYNEDYKIHETIYKYCTEVDAKHAESMLGQLVKSIDKEA